ncbi:beta-ketoacyl synthase domain-containing protein [Colletotrichum graminicola]|uniref:Beta-ketoacyl synthase domain-containing protein n=1 Tax=Colletotrichum graminicola (strain M1.001 / M2 / FGSC 10212) TaxID=645133 RepID=E3QIG0_COLGM|nr:beta-ketoacyl synthase domain-containing protein [Colletotrichum graminicola M1.001]EFQ30570.1 beta-ketoacyl synthase domain-containing protein [Colletotrichum graminicola M1.001]WDK21277.1 beta-ketoacyl synthase domain-containing protein [Colletotrichum graminicola]
MTDEVPIPIAVIGMGCRLPGGSDNPDKLWDMLSEGRSGWREIPADRWNKDSFYHPDPEAKEAVNFKGLYFLDQDIAAFDARFFNIHPHEAHCLDPQQRILLETTYEALENAGQTIAGIKGSDTSVHVGAYATDFERMGYKDTARTPKAHMIGTGIAILSNRISYVFDLHGPSSTVDTGCSGSMVALHQACHGLRARESKMAIVAGTQLVLTPDQIIPMSSVGMTNPDGKCYVFDSRGSGYARGEGVVTLILKRLDDAVKDGDKVHAIIRNSGLNQDGKTVGLTLPNPIAQANLMRLVYKNAGLDPADTVYVEAHGTGTQAGDNAEISSIAEVFCPEGQREDGLYVGSIKSNIGHLEASSGVAGLLKAILILKHGAIPPNIDFIEPKPVLHLEERKIKIATKTVPLPSSAGPRRVSVNSFGYGGTNAHVILEAPPSTYVKPKEQPEDTPASATANGVNGNEEKTNGHVEIQETASPDLEDSKINGATEANESKETGGVNGTNWVQETQESTPKAETNDAYTPQLYVLSARSEASLKAMVSNLQGWVSSRGDPSSLSDLAYTLSTRRSELHFRFSAAAGSRDELVSLLGQNPRITKAVTSFRSVFLFTGQGAQWHAMGLELTRDHPVFRESMLRSERILKQLGAEWSLVEELSRDEDSSRVGQAEISQPSTTAVQIALVDLLKSYHVFPDLVLGHSSGEIAAGYAAEALDHETALEISYRRGFMSQACARVISGGGAMMAVGLGEEDVKKYIEQARTGLVCVACVNSPVSTTISGDESAIDELKQILDEESIFNRKLKVDTAYHSHHMKKVAAEYLESIAHIKTRTPNPAIKFYSSVLVAHKTGGFDAQYWVDNLVSPVRFGNALELLCRKELADIEPAPLTLFTEIGPHGALAGPVRQTIKALDLPGLKSNYLPTLARGRDASISLLETAGKLFEFGYPVSLQGTLSARVATKSATLVDDLAPYPWDHSTSYLYESSLSKQHRFRAHPPHDLLGLRVAGTTNQEPTWRNLLGVESLPWLRDHVVDGFAIFPASGYISMAIEAVRQISIDRHIQGVISQVHLKNISFSKSIIIPERRTDGLPSDVEVLLTLRPVRHLTDRTWESFRIMALSPEDVWHEHCSGHIMVEWTSKEDEVEGLREENMTTSNRLKDLQDIIDACDTQISGDDLYKNFTDNGNIYGPTFACIQSAKLGPRGAIAEITVPDVKTMMPRKYQQEHIIHPASLDTVFQLGIPLYRRTIGNGPVMPTSIDELSIKCNIGSNPGTKWTVSSSVRQKGFRFTSIDIAVFEETAEGAPLLPVLDIRGGSLRGIGEAPVDEATLPFHRKMSYSLKWQPDVDLVPFQNENKLPLLVEYLELLAFKQPHMKILEVGSGIEGDVALPLFQALDRPEGLLLDRYTYCCPSTHSESLVQVKTLLDRWADRVDYKTLDISKDLAQQGFQEGTYDLIIASRVLNGASFVDESLASWRKLLSPRGRVVLGALPVQDGQQEILASSEDDWHARLEHHGFQGVLPDHDDPSARPQMIVAMAVDARPSAREDFPLVRIVCQSRTDDQFASLADAILSRVGGEGFPCSLDDWSSEEVSVDAIHIVLDDAADPILASPTAERFTQIVSLVTRAKNILWVGCQASGADCRNPVKGMINGLARVVRRENAGMRFVTVDVQDDILSSPETLVARLSDIINRSFATPISTTRSDEDEYTFSNGQLLIPRVHADAKFDDWAKKSIYAQSMETGPFQQADRPLKLEVETPGLLSSLRFVDDETPSKPLGPFELELEARAYGVNFKDVFIAMGQMVPGVTMAGECSGVVRKVGSAVADKFNVGDRVCGIFAEPFSSHPRVDGNFSCHLPEKMPYSVGASVPVIFCTAYHCIVEVARLQRGESILIHAASGGVGQAAIQLAQKIGAEIFCTVGNKAKRQLLIDTFGIPPDHIFSSRLRTFKQGILRLTQGRGVDCVLNSLSGESLHDSFAVLAPLGTFVEIGKSDIYRKNEISMIPFDNSVTFAAVDLTVLARLKPAKVRETLVKVLSLFEDGTLHAVAPVTEMPMTNIEDAFRLIQSRKHTGKVVLVSDHETQVRLTVARPRPLSLLKDGTYVISGGLGDLGRRTAKFLAAHGAGHVVTLSRRKLQEEDQQELEKDLRALGAELHIIRCDVTDRESVLSAAAECSANLPPVRGVVHAGMVLRDHPFEIMSHDDYMNAIKPKVQGTQNLDEAFGASDSLDFFIMLSSITAILGKSGQSNYAVGNAYQDAFAHSKKSSSCRYIALNLGAVDGSLAIISLPPAQQEAMRRGSVLMSFDEVFAVLSYAMSAQANEDDLHQLILGFDRKSMEAVHDEMALANPMFSQVPRLEQKGEQTKEDATDIGKLLQQATSHKEVEGIVVDGIRQRFAMFIAAPVEDISPNASMDSFGLDSLVAIELKNFLVRTFQATLQTSEVLDAPNIMTLARVIILRSKLVSQDTAAVVLEKEEAGAVEKARDLVVEIAAPGANHNFKCCSASKTLQKMPLADFDVMLDDYLDKSRMFFSAEEFETLERDVAEFRKPDSIGRVFYSRLHEQAHDPEIENWQEKYFLQSMYLQRRMPLAPFNNFMAFHPLGEMGHTQAERAALVANIAFQCKQDLEADRWEPMTYMFTANCTDLWQYIFNTARLPGVPFDRMAKFPGNDYMAVLHRGHIFKVELMNREENVTVEALTKTFSSILNRQDTEESWTSILSTDDRTSWAENREALMEADAANKETIDMVEAAAFLVCLDDTEPTDAEDRIRSMMMLQGFNRWVDKSIAFVVCKNATSGTYVEHTMIDAMTLFVMQTAIVQGITTYSPPRQVNGHANGVAEAPREFSLKTTPALDARILHVRQRFEEDISLFGYRDIVLGDFGKDILLDRHLPIKGMYDLMGLLANYYYYGYNAQSWEAVSMSHYHKGRPDIVQVNIPTTARFCTVAEDESVPASQRFEMMVEAANARNQVIKDAFMGRCYQRTLRALELCAEEGEELPGLFRNPLYEQTVEPNQMFSNTDGLSPESCFIMQNPKRFWMTYYVTDAGAHFSVITGKEEVIAWADCLQRASLVMKALIDAA